MRDLNIKKNTIVIVLLAAMNIPILLALLFKFLPSMAVLYFYRAECAFLLGGALLLAALILIKNAKRLAVFFILLFAAAFIVFSTHNIPSGNLKLLLTFWGLYGLCWVAYVNVSKGSFGLVLKRLHPLEQFFCYLVFMTLTMFVCFFTTVSIYDDWKLVQSMPVFMYETFFTTAMAVPTLSLGFLKIIDMIGPRHFLLFLVGAYHRPVELDRVVLFLDMVDSSTMAETLGAKQSMSLIARFIFDALVIFRLHGGDVLNYTGDGLVVLWPRKNAHRALASVVALRARLEQNKPLYQKEFGITPDFRIGLHAGKIVIAQIGEEKLFLGPYGDIVNTASRLEKLNKELNTKVLFSAALLESIKPAQRIEAQSLGKQNIRGKQEPIEVFTLQDRAGMPASTGKDKSS